MINNQLDETDHGILTLLQSDARITHKEIAHRLYKSITAIHMRIKRLIEGGYIKQYTIILDHKKIGKGLVGYIQVQLGQHSPNNIQSFLAEAHQVPEVIECCHMTGSFDFLLKIAVRDMEQYQQLLVDRLAALPGVENIQSFFVISEQRMRFILP